VYLQTVDFSECQRLDIEMQHPYPFEISMGLP
jgi:hypothetical protein